MKKLLLLTVFIQYISPLWAQKPPVDTAAFFNWPTIQDWPYPAISNNGKYAMYSVKHIPKGSSTMMVHALNSDWKMGLPGVQKAAFTDDSRQIIFIMPNDSLCLFTLATEEKAYIPKVKSFQLFIHARNEWLACQLDDKELLLRNLTNGIQHAYKKVDGYVLSEDGATLVLKTIPDTGKSISLQWLDLSIGQVKEIWKGMDASDMHLDKAGRQLAFLAQDADASNKAIRLYKAREEKAALLGNEQAPTMPENMELDGIDGFSKDGSKLFLQIRQKQPVQKTPSMVPVNIWSYKDPKIQSQQLFELNGSRPSYLAVLNVNVPDYIQPLQRGYERVSCRTNNAVLLTYRVGEMAERYWNQAAASITYLVNANNEQRKAIPISRATISPEGKYITGYGAEEIWGSDLYVYEVRTNVTRNITTNIPTILQDNESDILLTKENRGLSLAGWLPEDTALLIYDSYDIWKVDPTGKKTPVNLTNGRGQKWQFRLAEENLSDNNIIQQEWPWLLKGFNKATKENAFYQLTYGNAQSPELLCKGNYTLEMFSTSKGQNYFLKARDAEVYLVKREQAEQSPNIFFTTDFKRFTQVSQVYPEKSVNWLTSELVHFKTLDGISAQAILYKPENFDTLKKYPLLILYYDKKSDELNKYRLPIVDNGGELDIPWFVSHGYLVLLPDIHYKMGEPGPSAYRSVVGAVHHIAKLPYVDKTRIGIQGHSFGGYETNYLVTHSNLFAAAMSSSGICDVTSDFGNVWPGDNPRQEYWETRNGRMGTTPWENPDLYVKNSPIFFVDQVKAPILMMQNRDDKNVHFEQGLEFFLALRRAGKRVWMLEYDNGGHGVWGAEYKDYLLRMTQFFDHYLKGAPAPKWMTQGIPASRKGLETGFELDYTVKTPGPGLLIEEKKGPVKKETIINAKGDETSGQ